MYVYRRTKNKIKFQNGELYSNPTAETDGVEMDLMGCPIPIPRYHSRYNNIVIIG